MMLFYALWKVHTPNSKFSLVLLNEGQPHAAPLPPHQPPHQVGTIPGWTSCPASLAPGPWTLQAAHGWI